MEINVADMAASGVGHFSEVAPGVHRLGVVFVNVYAVETEGGWVLVDTGLPGFAPWIRRAVAVQFGDKPPLAIILTHGHFDHAGNAAALGEGWEAPIWAHEKESSYLRGQSDYAPGDPTTGGALAFLSRFFPTRGRDLGSRLRLIPADGSLPMLPGWRVVHTPGHTAGHISLYREDGGVLLAGDAFATMDLDSWPSQVTREHEISPPPVPLTPDWDHARRSVLELSDLNLRTVAAGHGLPMSGRTLSRDLAQLAEHMAAPPPGRYHDESATYHPDGSLDHVPPPVPDPLPKRLIVGGLVAIAGLAAMKTLLVSSRE